MNKRYEITALCGMGLGTSSLARMAIMDFVSKYQINANVTVADIGMVTGLNSDIILTTKSMESHIPQHILEKTRVIFVVNLIKREEINENLKTVFQEWGVIA